MDILIKNGDISVTDNGDYVFAFGIDEIFEHAVMCAKIRKGSFIYNKALGTELVSAQNEKTAAMLINEALIDAEGFCAEVRNMRKLGDKISFELAVKNNEEIKRAEVTVNADL